MGKAADNEKRRTGRPDEPTDVDSPGGALWVVLEERTCLREALAGAIERAEPRPRRTAVLGCRDVDELAKRLEHRRRAPLVVLLGQPPRESSPEVVIDVLRSRFDESRIAVLVDGFDDTTFALWHRCRPAALIPSCYSAEQVAACLEVVGVRGTFVPNDWVELMLRHASPALETPAPPEFDQVRVARIAAMLTPRQREVMRYVAMGRSNKYIASELDVCESTIKVHVSELLRRLGATSRTHAAWLISHLPASVGLDSEVRKTAGS